LNLVLAARTEGAFRHFLQDVVAADGFDDVFLGFLAVVVIFAIGVMLVAMRWVFAVGRLGLVSLGMLAMGGVVGMRRVLACPFVQQFRARCKRCRRRIEVGSGRQVRLGSRRLGTGNRLIMAMRIMLIVMIAMIFVPMIIIMIMLVVFVIMVFVVMAFVVMMIEVMGIGFGLMRVGIVSVDKAAVVKLMMPMVEGLRGLRRIGGGAFDDLALHPIATAPAT